MIIIIATKNEGKIKEIKPYFKDFSIKWLTFKDFNDFPEVIEDGKTFKENALLKASQIAGHFKNAALADDSGLVVDYLNGQPGIYSSRYAGPNATDKENREKLLKRLKEAKSIEDRKARFICQMILWDPLKGLVARGNGTCDGHIGFAEKGTGGFGYDSIFIPNGFKKTIAEIDQAQKNSISHRGKAIRSLASSMKEERLT